MQLGGRDARDGRRISSSACTRSASSTTSRRSLAIGMVLSEPPAPAPADVEVRRVATDDEYLRGRADRGDRLRRCRSRPQRAALRARPEQRRSTSPTVDGVPGRACVGLVRRTRRDALRRLDAAGGDEAAAPTVRSSRRGGTTRSHAERPCSSRRQGRCRDRSSAGSGSARCARSGSWSTGSTEWPRESLRQGRLRDPRGRRAGRGRLRAR